MMKKNGITVHYIDEGIDTGDIIVQKSYPINDSDTYKSLLEKAYVCRMSKFTFNGH